MRGLAAPWALMVLLSSCVPSSEEAGTVEVPNSEGGSARLRIIDDSGFLLSAVGAVDAGAADDFEIQAVPNASNTIRVAWIASPCENEPQLTIVGDAREGLELVLDRGPVPDDVACPGVGAVHGVDLVFNGDVSLDNIDARMVGQ